MQLSALPDTLYGLDLLVNGSPAGMTGFDELPLPQALLDTLDSTTHVADVVTAPVMTPLLTFAAARGCKVQTGPEMALAQMRLMGQFIGAIPQAQERRHEELGCDRHRQRRGRFCRRVTACCKGLSVLMLEKAGQFGGTSAISGGAVWLHDTDRARRGQSGSAEAMKTYLRTIIGEGQYREDLAEAFVSAGREALAFLEREGQ